MAVSEFYGIDISAYQGNIDWPTFAAGGKNNMFVISRTWIGHHVPGGNPHGDFDAKAEVNWQGCLDHGIPIQPYMFTYAKTVADVDLECEDIIWWFRNHETNCKRNIVFIDIEGDYWAGFPSSTFLTLHKRYKENLAAAGIEFGIYSSSGSGWPRFSDDWYRDNCLHWVANWGSNTGRPFRLNWKWTVHIHQYKGGLPDAQRLPGIPSRIDEDEAYDPSLFELKSPVPPPDPPKPDPDPPEPPIDPTNLKDFDCILYRYDGRRNDANKLKNITKLWSGNIVPYNSIDPRNFSFILPEYYDANYVVYQFAGRKYYSWVEINVMANGEYIYRSTIDPLTTGYYSGAWDVKAMISRSSAGDEMLFDSEIPLSGRKLREMFTFGTDPNRKDAVVFVVASNLDHKRYSSGVNCYVYEVESIIGALRFENLSSTNLKQQIASLLKIYIIRQFPWDKFPHRQQAEGYRGRLYITAADLLSDILDNRYTPGGEIEGIPLSQVLWKSPEYDIYPSWYGVAEAADIEQNISRSIEIEMTRAIYNTEGLLFVPYIGNLKFRLSDYNIVSPTARTVSVGYKEFFDFSGGNRAAVLMINNIPIYENMIVSAAQENVPITYPSAVTNYFELAVGGATAIASAAAGDAAGAAKGAIDLIAEQYKISKSPPAVRGSGGGTVDAAMQLNPFISFELPQTNGSLQNFWEINGKIKNSYENVLNDAATPGYHRTEAASLKSVGYSQTIARMMEEAVDSGFFII